MSDLIDTPNVPPHQKCQANGCMVAVDLPRILCGVHWMMLSAERQQGLFDAWQLNELLDNQSQLFHMLLNDAITLIGKRETTA